MYVKSSNSTGVKCFSEDMDGVHEITEFSLKEKCPYEASHFASALMEYLVPHDVVDDVECEDLEKGVQLFDLQAQERLDSLRKCEWPTSIVGECEHIVQGCRFEEISRVEAAHRITGALLDVDVCVKGKGRGRVESCETESDDESIPSKVKVRKTRGSPQASSSRSKKLVKVPCENNRVYSKVRARQFTESMKRANPDLTE